ncbi:MAG: hypothetical protein ABSF82_10625 [Candidatus Bathyarchaeia archaeon]
MVYKSFGKKQTTYRREICGFGYSTLKTAEACEEFCGTHGYSSLGILEKAIYSPTVQVVSIAVL